MGYVYARRYHDISCGHRVYGHEGKCAHLHGHNYRIHFQIQAQELDKVGRVLDFGMIKLLLCQWIEGHWDHRFLLHELDPWLKVLQSIDNFGVVPVPFNPTAENMAKYLVDIVGPQELHATGAKLIRVTVEETSKCAAIYSLLGQELP